jgi:3-oxoacyl-[acyl-carrier-protein] synthase I
MAQIDLALIAFGAATSLGLGAAQVAAAVRAGISQAGPDAEAEMLDEALDVTAVVGHAASEITHGFSLLGRRACLARAAVEDLLSSLPLASSGTEEWGRARVLFVVSPPLEEVFLEDAATVAQRMRGTLLSALTHGLGLPIQLSQAEVIASGHAGTAVALKRASELIEVGAERVLLVAVDSYLDELHVGLLLEGARIKHSENPAGFSPGEAAVAMLIERPTVACCAKVVAVELCAGQPSVQDVNELAHARGLAGCTAAALAAIEPGIWSGDVFVDLNGEPWRSLQWGYVLTELGDRFAGHMRLPAMSVGEIGAASGALGVLLASQSFARRYASADVALVLSVSEDGTTSCIAVRGGCANEHGHER